jgi:hypothetical protein
MNEQKVISCNFGTSIVEGIWANKDGRHYCSYCKRLIKVGQRIRVKNSPMPFHRKTQYIYEHIENKDCLVSQPEEK